MAVWLLSLGLAVLGAFAGIASGLLGIGGGVIVIPALMYLFHFGYREAVGTSLGMMLPPIGLFAFLTYWRAGGVDLRAAMIMAVAFAGGAFASAWIMTHLPVPEAPIKRVFALLLLYMGLNMLLHADPRAGAAWRTLMALGLAIVGEWGLRLLGRHWERRAEAAVVYATVASKPVYPDYEI